MWSLNRPTGMEEAACRQERTRGEYACNSDHIWGPTRRRIFGLLAGIKDVLLLMMNAPWTESLSLLSVAATGIYCGRSCNVNQVCSRDGAVYQRKRLTLRQNTNRGAVVRVIQVDSSQSSIKQAASLSAL